MSLIAQKKCGHCKEIKKLDAFTIDNSAKTGRANTCRACYAISAKSDRSQMLQKKRYAKYTKSLTKSKKILIAKSARKRLLRNNFDLTHEEYEQLHQSQNGLCAICEEDEMVDGRHLAVDHDHYTGKIRGLLCSRCNLMIGRIEKDIGITMKMLEYIKRGGPT